MVLSSNGGVCSAVVLAPDVVLTAAHCVTGAAEHRVHFRDEAGEPVLIVPAAKAVHPGYNAKAIETRQRSIDLALVRIPERPARPVRAGDAERREGRREHARRPSAATACPARATPKTTGTFRTASLKAVEPYGPSRILLWARGLRHGERLPGRFRRADGLRTRRSRRSRAGQRRPRAAAAEA